MLKYFDFSRPMQHLNNYTFVVVDRNHFICVFLNVCSLRAFFKQKFKKNHFSILKIRHLDFSELRSQSSLGLDSNKITFRAGPNKFPFATPF